MSSSLGVGSLKCKCQLRLMISHCHSYTSLKGTKVKRFPRRDIIGSRQKWKLRPFQMFHQHIVEWRNPSTAHIKTFPFLRGFGTYATSICQPGQDFTAYIFLRITKWVVKLSVTQPAPIPPPSQYLKNSKERKNDASRTPGWANNSILHMKTQWTLDLWLK